MKAGSSGGCRKRKYAQMKLVEFDENLESHCESVEDEMFDREIRNATLKSGEFRPPSGSIFEAIFHELKRKAEREKDRHHFSKS
jgi:hypothetical protein